jgi:hypothetical protein
MGMRSGRKGRVKGKGEEGRGRLWKGTRWGRKGENGNGGRGE